MLVLIINYNYMKVSKVELNELSNVAASIKSMKIKHSNVYFSKSIVVTVSSGRSFFANFGKNAVGELVIKFIETQYSIDKANKSIAV